MYPTLSSNEVVTETLGSLNATFQPPSLIGLSTLAIQVAGTFSGTITFYVSIDGTNFVAASSTGLVNQGTGAYNSTITTAGIWQTDVSGYDYVRLKMTSYSSGTATVTVKGLDSTMSALDAPLPSGSNTIGTVDAVAVSSGTGFTLTTAATTNATSVKTSACSLFTISCDNVAASTRYLKLYNKASAPTVGTDVPILTIPVATDTMVSLAFGSIGQKFTTGLAYAVTAGSILYTDTTACAAGDCHVAGTYS